LKTLALFFPFDLFGSAGAAEGAELLAEAFRELLDDNRRERKPTRARAYAGQVRVRRIAFDSLPGYQSWREKARMAIRKAFHKKELLFWVAGNHLGALPVYEELGQGSGTLVVQLDAHLDIYNLSDCKKELSHGNFLLHAEGPLPDIISLGSRELLLPQSYVDKHYRKVFPAAQLAVDSAPALDFVGQQCAGAKRVVIDLDCDVFDPAFFPAVTHPQPFGLSPQQVLQILEAAWSDRIAAVAISEFDPARDQNDRCLGMLIWMLEYLLLKRHEPSLHRS
jgi:agmatinase